MDEREVKEGIIENTKKQLEELDEWRPNPSAMELNNIE